MSVKLKEQMKSSRKKVTININIKVDQQTLEQDQNFVLKMMTTEIKFATSTVKHNVFFLKTFKLERHLQNQHKKSSNSRCHAATHTKKH